MDETDEPDAPDSPERFEGPSLRERPAARLVAMLLLIGCVAMGGGFVIQRAVLFPGQSRQAEPNAIARHPTFEALWLDTESGPVEAWYQAAATHSEGAAAPAVIFAHGNGELIDDWPTMLAPFAQLGVGLMLVEYPGYGRSAGTSSEASIAEAMRAAYDTLASRQDVDADRIVLYGRSLGGGAVCSLLGQRRIAALILQSTFTSATDLAWQLFKLPRFIVRDPFRNLDAVEDYEGPTLVIHGRHDDLIPYQHGVLLDRAARDSRLITYACGHNDCPPDWRLFWRDVHAFLEQTVSAGRDAGHGAR